MKIIYNTEEKSVVIDGISYTSSFQIQSKMLNHSYITSEDWADIITFFYRLDHEE
jgi:hypothetical protein